MGINVPQGLVVYKPKGHKVMSPAGLALMLTTSERSQLRGTAGAVKDLKEELDRSPTINNRRVKELMLTSGLFDQDRIDELFE